MTVEKLSIDNLYKLSNRLSKKIYKNKYDIFNQWSFIKVLDRVNLTLNRKLWERK